MVEPGKPVAVAIGLGSNLGNSVETLQTAIDALRPLSISGTLVCSSFYRSAPLGFPDQPDFVNAVCRMETSLAADELLQSLLEIERENGRQRSGVANAPRTLDLDLLLYGDRLISVEGLQVPHPRLHERAFVLYPLLEIAPDVVIPGRGPARELLEQCRGQCISRIGDLA
jgi:2-amino-4-hydroxy-6-hydroxymethyldihydropteridine diphosphokinase